MVIFGGKGLQREVVWILARKVVDLEVIRLHFGDFGRHLLFAWRSRPLVGFAGIASLHIRHGDFRREGTPRIKSDGGESVRGDEPAGREL